MSSGFPIRSLRTEKLSTENRRTETISILLIRKKIQRRLASHQRYNLPTSDPVVFGGNTCV